VLEALNDFDIEYVLSVIDVTQLHSVSQYVLDNSDVIVLNKIDLIKKAALQDIRKRIKSKALILPATYGKIDLPKIKKHIVYQKSKGNKHSESAISFSGSMMKSSIWKIVRKYKRAKGFVYVANQGYEFDVVNGQLSKKKSKQKRTDLVIIDSFSNFSRTSVYLSLFFAQKKPKYTFSTVINFFKQLD
jgi:G3E family GTPase